MTAARSASELLSSEEEEESTLVDSSGIFEGVVGCEVLRGLLATEEVGEDDLRDRQHRVSRFQRRQLRFLNRSPFSTAREVFEKTGVYMSVLKRRFLSENNDSRT